MASISLKDKAYTFIKDNIIRCEYLPGQVLVESEIIEMVGASRTPIREALNKLEQERLVRIAPKRGVFVADITVATVCDVYDVRELVEPHLVEKFANRIPEEKLELLYAEFAGMGPDTPMDEYYFFDDKLHRIFIDYANNAYLQIMMEQIYGQNNRIRVLTGRASRKRMDESQEEHRNILDALRQKNYTGAAEAMRNHLRRARSVAMESITHSSSAFFGVE